MKNPQQDLPLMTEAVTIYCEDNSDVDGVIAQIAQLPVRVYVPYHGLSFDALLPAVIVTGANVLIAIIGGLFSYIQAKHGRTIHIKGTEGFEVTVPADTSPEELDRLINLATANKADQLILLSSGSLMKNSPG